MRPTSTTTRRLLQRPPSSKITTCCFANNKSSTSLSWCPSSSYPWHVFHGRLLRQSRRAKMRWPHRDLRWTGTYHGGSTPHPQKNVAMNGEEKKKNRRKKRGKINPYLQSSFAAPTFISCDFFSRVLLSHGGCWFMCVSVSAIWECFHFICFIVMFIWTSRMTKHSFYKFYLVILDDLFYI